MPSVVRTFDHINKKHPFFDVDEDHISDGFLVPDGKVMGGRDGNNQPWEITITTEHDCGAPSWSTIFDDHFHFPIGMRLEISVKGGPKGDQYEGHFSGAIELWYKDLG